MIKKIPYSKIDFEKYDYCLENSVQKNFYAKKEILDFLCDSWELLIYKDYQFVMPIPLVRKYKLEVVLNPLFCQQLGICGIENNTNINQLFLDFFRKNYHYLIYPFNSHNHFEKKLSIKKNYKIFKTEYTNLKKRYYKGRKSSVKSAKNLQFREVVLDQTSIEFIKKYFKGLDKKSDLEFLFKYLNFLNEKKILKLYGSFNNEQLINLAILVEQEDENYLLALINDPENIKKEGASFVIDQILQNTIENKDFNFMGSSIRGIEVFFKSFGAEMKSFPILKNSKKDLMLSYFKRL